MGWSIVLTLLLGLAEASALAAVDIIPTPVAGGDNLIQVLPPDAIPAVVAPRFEAPSWLSPSDKVLVVEVNGDARAYPVRILVWHEIVDDTAGGMPIAATYCPLCGTGIGYNRQVGGRVLTFHVSGKLLNNDLVMFDAETNSLWPQIRGEAVTGPMAGQALELIPLTTTTLDAFQASHPGGHVLARPRCDEGIPTGCGDAPYQRSYSYNPYPGYDTDPRVPFPRPFGDDGASLGPKEVVLGVLVGRAAKAYPYRVLANETVVNDVLGAVAIVVTFVQGAGHAFEAEGRQFRVDTEGIMKDQDGGHWDMATGLGPGGKLESVRAIPAYWFAWHDFYPESKAYGFQLGGSSGASAGASAGIGINPLWIMVTLGAAGALGGAAVVAYLRKFRVTRRS